MSGTHHGNRHGRSEAARVAVLNAADNLLVEHGFAGVTVEGIAARAQVAKQTIYRWWPSKTDILFEALVVDAEEHFAAPDHGGFRRDLRDHLGQLGAFLTRTDAGSVCLALLGVAQHDRTVAARVRACFVEPERERGRAVLLRARRRGEIPGTVDIESAIDQLVGPIYYRALVTGQGVSPEFIDGLVERYIDGVRNRPPSSSRATSPAGRKQAGRG